MLHVSRSHGDEPADPAGAFDRAVYPMDWVWWTGRSPAQRVLERLPEDDDAPPTALDRGTGPQGLPDD